MKGGQNVHSALCSQWQPAANVDPKARWRETQAPLAIGDKPLHHSGFSTEHTHLFIGEMISHSGPQAHKKEN